MNEDMVTLTGQVTRWNVQLVNFRVGLLRVKGEHYDTPVVGINIDDLPLRALVDVIGKWDTYKGKTQFKIVCFNLCEPTTPEEMKALLIATVPGVGPVKAARMVHHFGDNLTQILDECPDRLVEINGISPAIAERIANGWKDQKLDRHIAKILIKYAERYSPAMATRVRLTLGPTASWQIQKNPYCLVRVRGIGFKTADDIAVSMGWGKDSPERAEAILQHALSEASNNGHVCVNEYELFEKASTWQPNREILASALTLLREMKPPAIVRQQINNPAGSTYIYYLPHLLRAEKNLAVRIRDLLQTPLICPVQNIDLNFIVCQSEKALGLELTAEQHAAVLQAFTKPISIITGGPGTGKTCVVRVIVDVCKKLQIELAMCAPTGRASKHLSNVTGGDARTIHRIFGYHADEGGWT